MKRIYIILLIIISGIILGFNLLSTIGLLSVEKYQIEPYLDGEIIEFTKNEVKLQIDSLLLEYKLFAIYSLLVIVALCIKLKMRN